MSDDQLGARTGEARSVELLCVDEPSVARTVRTAAADTDVSLTVEQTTERRVVLDRIEAGTVDCFVLNASLPDIDAEVVAGASTAPVVLYSDAQPATVDDNLLDAVDTLVDRGTPSESAGFLIEKVIGLVGGHEEKSEYALARALARVDDDDACEGHQFLVDADGRITWASEPFESVFPVDSVDTTPSSNGFYDRLATLLSDSPGAIQTVTRADRAVDASTEETVTIQTNDGSRHFTHSAHELPDSVGDFRLEVFREVTPQVRREARLELLDLLVEQAQDGLYTLDENGIIDFCNASLAEMLGYEPGEIIGRHASETLAEGELEKGQRTVQHLQTTDAESTTVDMTFVDRWGVELEVSIHYTLLPSEDGSYAGLMGVARDITERKERERTLEQYRTLVESAADPMYVLDTDGRIELLNEPMAAFFGREKETVIGENVNTLLSDDNRKRGDEALKSILRDEERTFESFESWLTDADGNQRRYEVTIGAIYDDEAFVGSVGTLRDITERERRRQELDFLRQVFARVLRHNLRSELSIIMGNTEVVMDELDGDAYELAEAVLERSEVLETTASKARAIEGVLDSESGRTTRSIATVVGYAVENLREEHPDRTIERETPASLSVHAHPRLALAVENLVENALEHGEPLTGRDGAPDVVIDVQTDGDRVSLSVIDGGDGVPEPELAVLERGTETPLKHGSGLGLWLINWIVERSGGDLSFDNDAGRTVATVELERGPDQPTQ
jgi:PAS domain S-box-containing protein